MSQERLVDAENALIQLRKGNGEDPSDEFSELVESTLLPESALAPPELLDTTQDFAQNDPPPDNMEERPLLYLLQPQSTFGLWNTIATRKAFFSAGFLHLTQQLCGINAATYYSTTLFSASFDQSTSIKLTFLMGISNLGTSLIAIKLISFLGRKTSLLISQIGMFFCGLILVASFHFEYLLISCLSLIAFVPCFGLGLGSIPW